MNRAIQVFMCGCLLGDSFHFGAINTQECDCCSLFKETAKLLPRVTVPFVIPTGKLKKFSLCHFPNFVFSMIF